MKLRDLDGHFFGRVDAEKRSCYSQGEEIEGAQGVTFQCPSCAVGKPRGEPDGRGFAGVHYVRVCFANPRNAEVAPPAFDENPRWEMSGSGLDDLTLEPSINCDIPPSEEEQRWYAEHPEAVRCTWHGWVKNGDAT